MTHAHAPEHAHAHAHAHDASGTIRSRHSLPRSAGFELCVLRVVLTVLMGRMVAS